jgi:lipoate-protein ligase A
MDEPLAFLDLTLPALADNLALDEALLVEADAGRGGEVLRLWRWPTPAVVLGAGGVVSDDVDLAACRADGVPLGRRSSGGGTVLLGPGCLLFSLVLRTDRDPALREIPSSYRLILGRVAAALAGLLPDIEPAGVSDLASGGRKFSGNAQQRKRSALLHHGTLLHGLDRALVGRYLREPPRQPDYRGRRGHAEFLADLPDRPDEIAAQLRATWRAERERTGWPEGLVRELAAAKYDRDDWTFRR